MRKVTHNPQINWIDSVSIPKNAIQVVAVGVDGTLGTDPLWGAPEDMAELIEFASAPEPDPIRTPPSYIYKWFNTPEDASAFVNEQVWEGYELLHMKPMLEVNTIKSVKTGVGPRATEPPYRYTRTTRIEVLMMRYE